MNIFVKLTWMDQRAIGLKTKTNSRYGASITGFKAYKIAYMLDISRLASRQRRVVKHSLELFCWVLFRSKPSSDSLGSFCHVRYESLDKAR